MKEYINILKKHILFKDISDDNFLKVLECLDARVHHYVKNETICDAGKVTEIGFIVKGAAYASVTDEQGKRLIFRELMVGYSFGESVALANVENHLAITALNDCTILFISVQKLVSNYSFACDSTLRTNLITLLAQKNIALLLKNDIVSKKTIREKLLRYFYYQKAVANSSAIKTFFSKEELADYLSVNRSAMSRELSKMYKEGLLSYKNRVYTIKVELPDIFE